MSRSKRLPRNVGPEALVEALKPRLHRLFSGFSLAPGQAQRFLEETVVTYLGKGDAVAEPEAWFLEVLRSRCRRHSRERIQRLARAMDRAILESLTRREPGGPSPGEIRAELEDLLADLRAECRSALWNRYGLDSPTPARPDPVGPGRSPAETLPRPCLTALSRCLLHDLSAGGPPTGEP